jgi:hypothetical protein
MLGNTAMHNFVDTVSVLPSHQFEYLTISKWKAFKELFSLGNMKITQNQTKWVQ